MELFTRNNPEKHPMLRQLLDTDRINISIKKTFLNFYNVKINDANNVVIFDDPVSVIVGYFKYRSTGANKIYWMLELYEHQVIINSLYRFLRYLFFTGLGYLAVAIADAVFVSSNLRFNYVSMKYRLFIKNKRIRVIYNIPNMIKDERLKAEYVEKINEFARDKVALAIYAGSIQEGRDVDDFIKHFSSQSDFGLILCGPVKNENFRHKILNSSSVLYLGNLHQKEVLVVYEYCQIGLLTYDNYPLNVKLCAPVKIWEYLRANLKIVSNRNHALQTEWKCYVSKFYDEKNDVCSAVASALNSPQRVDGDVIKFDLTEFKISNDK